MGREVRMVPPHYVHPSWTEDDAPEPHLIGRDRAFYDQHIDDALAEWLADFDRVRAGHLQDWEREYYSGAGGLARWLTEGNPPPNPLYYRPWRDDEATWVQLWQTVSEGSPVSPPFSSRDELASYLADNGDFWDQERARKGSLRELYGRSNPGWGIEAARAFVEAGSAPTMMVSGGTIIESKDIPLAMRG